MMAGVIRGYHVIFCAYGFWLPNDPRGSWSQFVAAWDLFRYGSATTTDTRRSVAGAAHDQELREAAKSALKFPPVVFNGVQARAAACGFMRAAAESAYTVHACAVLPEHVHMVIGRNPRNIRQIVGHLKARATQALKSQSLYTFTSPTPWAEHCWNVFIDSDADMHGAIRYVEQNPIKEGKPLQQWNFITPYAQNTAGKPAG